MTAVYKFNYHEPFGQKLWNEYLKVLDATTARISFDEWILHEAIPSLISVRRSNYNGSDIGSDIELEFKDEKDLTYFLLMR